MCVVPWCVESNLLDASRLEETAFGCQFLFIPSGGYQIIAGPQIKVKFHIFRQSDSICRCNKCSTEVVLTGIAWRIFRTCRYSEFGAVPRKKV